MAESADRETFVVYADGSCIGNPGPGGWGVVTVEPGGALRELSGFDPTTTNNRMELTAAIEGLRTTPPGAPVLLRSDSEYLVKTIKLGWKRNRNLDLWRTLDAELARRAVALEWVKGHAGDALNNRADELANRAARAGLRRSSSGTGGPPTPEPASAVVPAQALCSSASREEEVAAQLRPMMREGEALGRCKGCGRMFVAVRPPSAASADGPPPGAAADETAAGYCSLAECQLKLRLASQR